MHPPPVKGYVPNHVVMKGSTPHITRVAPLIPPSPLFPTHPYDQHFSQLRARNQNSEATK